MFKKFSLKQKLTGLIVLLVLLTIFLAGYLTYDLRKNNLVEKFSHNINALADLKEENIQAFIDKARKDIEYVRQLEVFEPAADMSDIMMEDTLEAETDTMMSSDDPFGTEADPFASEDMSMEEEESGADMGLAAMMGGEADMGPSKDYAGTLSPLQASLNLSNIIVTDAEGSVQYTSNPNAELQNIRKIIPGNSEAILEQTREDITFTSIFIEAGAYYMLVGAPTEDENSLVFHQINMEPVYRILEKDLELGETVETILASKQQSVVDEEASSAMIMNPLKFTDNTSLDKRIFLDGSNNGTGVIEAVKGNEGFGSAVDYRGKHVLAAWRYMNDVDWGLVVKIDKSELNAEAFVVVKRFSLFALGILILTFLLSILFSQYFVSPLLSLKDSLTSLAKGVLPNKIDKQYDDEVGQMAETTDDLVQGLKRTADFAERIGKGDLNAEFKPLSKGDILGNALLEMRNSLRENELRDKERNWIVTGVAEISEILRSHDNIDALGDAVIQYITDKIEAIQGAFYVVNSEEGEKEENSTIEMTAAYAYNKKKYLQAKFKFAQGLVGQAAAEKATVMRTEIPEDYVSITSGLLGEQRPQCILITPMITEEKVFGVLEFASIHKFSDMQVKFVEEISLIIARTIFNIKVNDRTRRLLEESQKMSNELQEQQEVLRQNAEEMAATQEELKRTNQRLEDQIEEVNRTQNRMQLLLENASEVIAIYEEDKSIRYISPSVTKILGYDQNDLIGVNDQKYVHKDYLDQYHKMFQEVFDNPYESKTVQFEYIKKNGEAIWLEATATNLMSDPAIQGIIVNSRDITERRRAEQEERMRSKMQALSENSPDLITRFDNDGNFFYINPVIEQYTGYKPSDFLNKSIGQVSISDEVKDNWFEILKKVEQDNDKVATEMDFPSEMGDRVMQVNAIPEFDESEKLESVLVVSHDITDRKQIELEIQSKNKKITESINYAKRIQGAILPNNQVIRKFLPDSFILYKARDVVSGDFPWFVRMDNTVYFAAVDCTGHGVPGALISLIGYFLLNEIVKGRKITDPGEILDNLDHSVTKTLRQDQDDSKTKDGMDIALCKFDFDNQELTYAGAHRPLYYHDGKELQEIKGDRFPIGGGVFKNQTTFQSTKIKMKKGDSMFFCSDGYPDQFGGPNNRKFGPKRLRQMISDNVQKSMDDLYDIFDQSWEEWKGDTKQTDDVLLIGVRF